VRPPRDLGSHRRTVETCGALPPEPLPHGRARAEAGSSATEYRRRKEASSGSACRRGGETTPKTVPRLLGTPPSTRGLSRRRCVDSPRV